MAHTKLAEELSRYLKKEITPEEIQQFMVDYKDAEYESIGAATRTLRQWTILRFEEKKTEKTANGLTGKTCYYYSS